MHHTRTHIGKLFYTLLFTVCFFSFNSYGNVWIENNRFYAPGVSPYVETNVQIPANLISYHKNDAGNYFGQLEITMLFIQDSLIVDYDRYILNSPVYQPDDSLRHSMVDKKRFVLDKGEYLFQIFLKDHLNEDAPEIFWEDTLQVNFERTDKIQFSDIEFLESIEPTEEGFDNPFVKNNFMMIPQVLNFFPEGLNQLRFYAEFYNADKAIGDDFIATYSIRKYENDELVNQYHRISRQSPQEINGVSGGFNISNLPSGNYNLVVELRDRNNDLVATHEKFFQRSNPQFVSDPFALHGLSNIKHTFAGNLSKRELVYHLKSFLPVASRAEEITIRSLLREPDEERMQIFTYNFWRERNQADPALAFIEYNDEVDRVNNTYATNIEYGFETDRGRIYLKYGSPHNINRAPREPGAYPYEIWHYNYLPDNQSNIRFIFYNPDLVSNRYELIHSNARDEVYDPRWRMKIYRTFQMTEGGQDLDKTDFRDHFGSKLEDFIRE